jgi:hypothetical protein
MADDDRDTLDKIKSDLRDGWATLTLIERLEALGHDPKAAEALIDQWEDEYMLGWLVPEEEKRHG